MSAVQQGPGTSHLRMLLLTGIGLCIAWLLPGLGLVEAIASGGSLTARLAHELIWWGLGLGVLAWVLLVERRPLRSIGLKLPGGATLLWGVLFVVPLIASVMLCFAVILPLLGLAQDTTMTRSIVSAPLGLQIAMMVRAGVVEEILYRGYPIERLTALTGRRWLAALLSGGVFVAAHAGAWESSQLIVVAFGTVILTGLYLWRQDLAACMIAHTSTDIIGFALARAQM